MAQIVGPCVRLVAKTEFMPPPDVDWSTDVEGGAALAEFAGRACYQSWSKPNPATASNADYLAHILEVGHLAVLEHASASFYLTGISRSLSHELVRHRHLSFSQLSQRYTPEDDARVVAPPGVAGDPELEALLGRAAEASRLSYAQLLAALQARFAEVAHPELLRRQARQAARAVLPAATEARMVVTGNFRAWRHFIGMRATEHADLEIRQLAIACLRQLQGIAASVFDDFRIATMADGSEIATSPFVTEG